MPGPRQRFEATRPLVSVVVIYCFVCVCFCRLAFGVIGSIFQADMREMQNMYRSQYDELLTRAAVGAGSGTSPA